MNLEGKIVGVIGASSGVGEGAAMRAAEGKAEAVVIGARRIELLNPLAQKLQRHGVKTQVIQTDVTNHTYLENFIKKAVSSFGRLDVLINSAGVIQSETPIDEHPPQDNEFIINMNLSQPLNLAHYYVAQMKKQGHGVYIAISSQASKHAFPGQAAYNASKAGLDHGIRSIDEDLKKLQPKDRQMYAFAIGPGWINTEKAKEKFPWAKEDIERSPTPEEFGDMVLEHAANPVAMYEKYGPVRTIETGRS